MATFWQGNWARSPQQQSGLQQISQSVPPPEKPSPHTARKKIKTQKLKKKLKKGTENTHQVTKYSYKKVTITIHFLRICFGNELVFTQIHENAKIVYTVLWFRSIKGTLSIAIRLYKSCSLPCFQYLCVWKIFCNNTLQKLVTLALLLNNKSPPRQNPRKKKQPLAEQERRRRQKNKKEEDKDRRTRKKKK